MQPLAGLKILGPALLLAATVFAPLAAQAGVSSQQNPVEVYTNDAVPTTRPYGVPVNTPLHAGQMTLEDVIQAHPEPPQLTNAAPQITTKTTASSENLMLMRGMQSALQEVPSGKPTRLKAPKLQKDIAPALQPAASSGMIAAQPFAPASTVQASATPVPPPADASVKYEAGRGPKDLATASPATPSSETASAETPLAAAPSSGEASSLQSEQVAAAEAPKATDMEQPPVSLDQMVNASAPEAHAPLSEGGKADVADAMMRRQPMRAPPPPTASEPPPSVSEPAPANPSASTQTASAGSANCETHVESWNKSCSEAGYPSSYVGKITGETRTVCPTGDLQDVWMENSCTPPAEKAEAPPPSPSPEKTAAAPAAEQPLAATAEAAPPPPVVVASAEQAQQAETPLPPPAPEEKPAVPATEIHEPVLPLAAEPATPAVALPPEASDVIIDASCGAASGLATNGKPAAELCAAGLASDVSGDGPWLWQCKGANGGMTVSCAAPAALPPVIKGNAAPIVSPATEPTAATAAEDGKCGMADGAGADQAPAGELCVKGVASRVNGGGPWTWACSGINGGKAAACTAQKKIDGACGTANSVGVSKMPNADLCIAGLASAVTGDGPWNWTCSGLYGGAAATCAAEARKDAVCGSATTGGHSEAPGENLCTVGNASAVSGEGPWNWTCEGPNGGATVTCSANKSVGGACGPANGVAVASVPSGDELCATGKATRVTGSGPWNWSCTGSEGGDAQSCTAPMEPKASEALPAEAEPVAEAVPETSEGFCGTAANVANAEKPSENLCAAGKAAKVKVEKNSWVWNCEGAKGGAAVSCTAPRMKKAEAAPAMAPQQATEANEAACGAAAGRGSLSAPSADLCDAGKATIVRGRGPWNWKCIKGKEKVACAAPKQVDGSCGASNGSTQKTAPVHGLCITGAPTGVSGSGPWMWTCVGAGGGVSVSCSAGSQAQTRIDGSCGAAANAQTSGPPVSNLCDSGAPSNVYGEGPWTWTWTCSGVNGGIASSCESQKAHLAAPPPPGPSVNGLCGAANGVAAVVAPSEGLCSAGAVTPVSGDGPWNWNCIGQNSGMTVSCTAPLTPPSPVIGSCGGASGQPTLIMPKSGLCSAGISSAVSGQGPWTWSCSGTNGGGAVGCVAPLATGGGSGMPSLVTPSSSEDAPAPRAAPTSSVKSSLVTPRLPSGPLPPLETGSLPGTKPFPPMPKGESAPTEPSVDMSSSMEAPSAAPELPVDNSPLLPPPVRDTIKPTPALKPPAINSEGKVIPGNHFILPDDLAVIEFTHGAENMGERVTPMLDKLASTLKSNSNVRVTLTAYAGLDPNTTPRDARRLSLARALAVRDYLTAKGVSSSRVDVRALGANVPSGDADRVDVVAN